MRGSLIYKKKKYLVSNLLLVVKWIKTIVKITCKETGFLVSSVLNTCMDFVHYCFLKFASLLLKLFNLRRFSVTKLLENQCSICFRNLRSVFFFTDEFVSISLIGFTRVSQKFCNILLIHEAQFSSFWYFAEVMRVTNHTGLWGA